MGDRVVIQFKKGDEVSPVIYGHWSGYEAPAAIARLRKRMADRPHDISYIAARCLQELGMSGQQSTGYGIWSVTEELTAKDSQGDAGVFVVSLGQCWHVKHYLGYHEGDYPSDPDIEWEEVKRE